MVIARKTDPSSSKRGAEKINRVRPTVVNLIARFVRLHCDGEDSKLTAEEIADRVSRTDLKESGEPRCKVDTYRKRVREAAELNLIRESESKKLCSITGQMASAFFHQI